MQLKCFNAFLKLPVLTVSFKSKTNNISHEH